MKYFLLLLFFLMALLTKAQIFTQGTTNGSISITPKGVQGKTIPSSDTTNVALGPSALRSVISSAGSYHSYGQHNTAIGNSSLRNNTYGNQNTALGTYALLSNYNGNYNTAVGFGALRNNIYSSTNTAVGFQSLSNNTEGYSNTAVGYQSLSFNTFGYENTALGNSALNRNSEGFYNSALGSSALSSNTTGNANTALGSSALFNNDSGHNNTAMGYVALRNNTIGGGNIALGSYALRGSTTGNYNTAVGTNALSENNEGNKNTALGYKAGMENITGIQNTFVGSNADASAGTLSNAMALGAEATVNASNKVRIGNSSVTIIEGQVAFTSVSDRRLKENIIYNSRLGLDFITRLQPASYNFISDKTKVRHDGFIAQDVEQVMQKLNLPFSGLKKAEDGTYSLTYSDFIIPLVNAIKELKAENDRLNAYNQEFKQQQTQLSARLEALELHLLKTNSEK